MATVAPNGFIPKVIHAVVSLLGVVTPMVLFPAGVIAALLSYQPKLSPPVCPRTVVPAPADGSKFSVPNTPVCQELSDVVVTVELWIVVAVLFEQSMLSMTAKVWSAPVYEADAE